MPCYVQELDDPSNGRGAPRKESIQSETSLRFADHGTSSGGSISPSIEEPQVPTYPGIPLSRILHPIEDPYPYHEAILAIKQEIKQSIVDDTEEVQPGFVEDDSPSDTKLELIHKRLKFMDPGMQDAMHKQLESPRGVGGVLSMLNTFNTMPVKTTLRNTELFHFCE